jgi:hypothetical protein
MAIDLNKGIQAIAPFKMNSQQPLDRRNVVENLDQRDSININFRFEGLQTFVISEHKSYQLIGGIQNENWVELATADSRDNMMDDILTLCILLSGVINQSFKMNNSRIIQFNEPKEVKLKSGRQTFGSLFF